MKLFKLSLVALTLACTSVHAIDLPGMGKKKEQKAENVVDAFAMQDGLLGNFSKATQSLLMAQSGMADALGLKDQAATSMAEAKAIGSGSIDKAAAEKAKAGSEAASKAIEDALKKGDALSSESKKAFAKSLVPYAISVKGALALPNDAKSFADIAQQQISAASMMEKLNVTKKLEPGVYVAKEAPGFIGGHVTTIKQIVGFLKANNIEVPKEATDLI